MATKKFDLAELKAIREEWTDIPLEAIPDQYRAIFKARKTAVDMYIDGQKSSVITERTDVNYTYIPKLIERCIN